MKGMQGNDPNQKQEFIKVPTAELTQQAPLRSLTSRVRVTTPPAVGTASLQITSRTQQARPFYRW